MPPSQQGKSDRSLSKFGQLAAKLKRAITPKFRKHAIRYVPPEKARAVVASFYMANISKELVLAQREVLARLTPSDVAVFQIKTILRHVKALDRLMATTPYRTVVILDIDCIPTREGAIDDLIARAEKGHLAGAAQRSNHIENNEHVFAAPSCLALTKGTFDRLGRPPFRGTERGDCAEELTYRAEERGIPVDLYRPVHAEVPMWPLKGDKLVFGHGTTYDGGFYHLFESRNPENRARFIARCSALAEKPPLGH